MNYKLINKYLFKGGLALSGLLLSFLQFSCADDMRSLETKGYLDLGVTKNVEVVTRSTNVEDHVLAVDVCTGQNDSIVKHYSDYESIGNKIVLNTGKYKVKVYSVLSELIGSHIPLAFDEPSFYGEKNDVVVKAGEVTPVSVECFLNCVKVTTEFTYKVLESFSSCEAKISNESGYLVYGSKEKRAGYFQPGYLAVDLTLKNKEGVEFHVSRLIEEAQAKDHYHFYFDLAESGDNNAGMDFNVTIETDPTNDEEHTVTVPLPDTGYEQRPPELNLTLPEGVEEGSPINLNDLDNDEDKRKKNASFTLKTLENGVQSVSLIISPVPKELQGVTFPLDLMKLSESSDTYKLLTETMGFVLPTDYSKATESGQVYSYTISPLGLESGEFKYTLSARDKQGMVAKKEVTYSVKSSLQTEELNDYDIWSHFAKLKGYVKEGATGTFKFLYKESSASEWSESGQAVAENGYLYASVKNLKPKTSYDYKLVMVEEDIEAEVKSFETEEATELYNGGFDEWWRKEDKDNSPWYAIVSSDATEFDSTEGNLFSFWDSGNGGTAILSKNPTSPETTEVHTSSGKAAKLASQYVGIEFLKMGKFAAGNLYTGHFCSANMGTYQAKINFGQPFTSRPTQLKGWFKYNRGTKVDYPKDGGEYKTILEQAGGDMCSVYIALVDNDGFVYDGKKFAYEVNGDLSGDDPANFKYKNAIDFSKNNKNVIAYGSITDEEAKGTGNWQEFTIDLKYRDLTRKPKYIIIVASASKYGDYFTGSTSSVMYVDDFSLIYDGEPTMWK